MKLSQVAQRVIELADQLKGEAEEHQRANPLGTIYDPSRPSQMPTSTEQTLRAFLLSQPVAVIYALILIMYAGRGDFDITDFMDQYEEMASTFDNPNRAVEQMLEKVPLPDYLRHGLTGLASAGIDVDSLLDGPGGGISA